MFNIILWQNAQGSLYTAELMHHFRLDVVALPACGVPA